MATANTRRNKGAEPNDLYQTDPKAVKLAIKAGVFNGVRSAYDPCNGLGVIAKELEAIGVSMRTSDLVDYGIGDVIADFLHPNQCIGEKVDAVVFNPPYTLTAEFIEQALRLHHKVIMFNRINFLETEKRAVKLQNEWGLTDVYLHASRVGCKKGVHGGYTNAVFYAWYILEPSKSVGAARLHWIV